MNIQRALLSVSDKTGLVDFARGLAALGVELLSTGGTAAELRAAQISVREAAELTGFPEILDGRVKTLHPKIHGGILQRRGNPADAATARLHDLPAIDLVCVNLYPFEQQPSLENMDIGGPALLRSAAKNHADVIVLCDPADYREVLLALQTTGDLSQPRRRALAQKALLRLSAYDAAIAAWLGPPPPSEIRLRYGENPHQTAVFQPAHPLPAEAHLAAVRLLHGKEMSYNNYLDADTALAMARELSAVPAAVIVKHTNPCGVATGTSLSQALAEAWEGDPRSAFGSIIALTRPVDLATARLLQGRFVEVILAPAFEPDALDFLRAKSRDVRLLALEAPLTPLTPRRLVRSILGGTLIQDADVGAPEDWRVVTRAPFPDDLRPLAAFGVTVGKYLASNAVLLVWQYAPGVFTLLSAGHGQPNRIDALRRLALEKASENLTRRGLAPCDVLAQTILVSDAFFPFPDSIEAAAAFGLRYIVEPGGSKKDADCIAAADAAEIAMAFTGCRHFRH